MRLLLVAVIIALFGCFGTNCQAFSYVDTFITCRRLIPGWSIVGNDYDNNYRHKLYATAKATTADSATSTIASTTASTKTVSSSPQVLEFIEPTTGVVVKLVGCMHYNPASIKLTTNIINELARDNKLGSVIIESCDIRWGETQKLPQSIRNILKSEMSAATDLTLQEYQRPVILGDQRINITISSLKQGLQETLTDFVTPWNGGWNRLLNNVTMARKEALPIGNEDGAGPYLNAFAFIEPKLLLAAPVSLIKYPLSYLFKAPIKSTLFFTLLFFIEQPADAATIVTMDQMTIGDWIGSFTVSAVEIALFARVFLKELLAQRNEILAGNILEQCKVYQTKKNSNSKVAGEREVTLSLLPFWDSLYGGRTELLRQKKNDMPAFDTTTMYVQDPRTLRPKKSESELETDKAVVAVLGMAHCNGIMKLLKEQKV